jgi:hypothetical protein
MTKLKNRVRDSGSQRLKRFPLINHRRRGYSGGPIPDFNGVPYYAPFGAPELSNLLIDQRNKVNKKIFGQ